MLKIRILLKAFFFIAIYGILNSCSDCQDYYISNPLIPQQRSLIPQTEKLKYFYSNPSIDDTLEFTIFNTDTFFFSQEMEPEFGGCGTSTIYNEVYKRTYKEKSGKDTLTFAIINGDPEDFEYPNHEAIPVLLEIQLGNISLSFEGPGYYDAATLKDLSWNKSFKTKNDSFYLEYTTKVGFLKLYKHSTGETWELIR